MHDLDVQIRDYIDATSQPLTIDDILYLSVGEEPVRPITQRTPRKTWNRGWLTAAAVAALVLITLGVTTLLVRATSVEPAAPTLPTTTIAVPETPVDVPGTTLIVGPPDRQGPPFRDANPGSVEWTQVDLDPYVSGFAGAPLTVQRDIDGYVISGNGVLTYSQDGRTWTTDPLSPELAEYQAFTSSGEWAVAGTGEWQQRQTDSRVLLRSDGAQWHEVDLPGAESSWPELPIVSGTSTLVRQGGTGQNFWVSTADGPFEMYEAPWDWPQTTDGEVSGLTILAAPDGGFVALTTYNGVHPDDSDLADGERDPSSALISAEIWTSPDGIVWTNNGAPGFLAADAISRSIYVTIRPHLGELLASATYNGAERRDTGNTVLGDYTSTNGLHWAPVPGPDATRVAESECWIHTMNMGYICASIRIEPETMFELQLSKDGETWVDINMPEVDFESYGFVGGAAYGGVGDILFLNYGDTWIGLFE